MVLFSSFLFEMKEVYSENIRSIDTHSKVQGCATAFGLTMYCKYPSTV
jgi:hypothetical protein